MRSGFIESEGSVYGRGVFNGGGVMLRVFV